MSEPLTKFSDTDLRAELQRREAAREAQRQQRHEEHRAKVSEVLSTRLIDLFYPRHDVTSCNDEAPDNTFGSENDTEYPRCVRCALLDMHKHNTPLPKGIYLSFVLSTRSYPEDEIRGE